MVKYRTNNLKLVGVGALDDPRFKRALPNDISIIVGRGPSNIIKLSFTPPLSSSSGVAHEILRFAQE